MWKINLQFSVMTTSHISFSLVISSWSATTNTLQTNSTFRDSEAKTSNKYNSSITQTTSRLVGLSWGITSYGRRLIRVNIFQDGLKNLWARWHLKCSTCCGLKGEQPTLAIITVLYLKVESLKLNKDLTHLNPGTSKHTIKVFWKVERGNKNSFSLY